MQSVQALARTYTATAIEVLAEIALNGEKEQARVTAAVALLDRAHGKPPAAGDKKPDQVDALRGEDNQQADTWAGLLQ